MPDQPVLDQRESQVRAFSRRFDLVFERAIGSVLVAEGGRRCIDFTSGGGTLNYGHNDPDMLQALVAHLQGQGLASGPDWHSPAKQRFLKVFCSRVLAPRGLSHRLQFTGPQPDDPLVAALALARKITGRQAVLAFGQGLGAAGPWASPRLAEVRPPPPRALADAGWAAAPGPLADALRWPYDGYHGPDTDTAAQLARWLDDPATGQPRPAAIVLETLQSEGGLLAASPAWVRQIAATAQRHGALLVLDDRITGGGRCGGFFSFEGLGVVPDLVLPSLSVSGMGLPMGLLLVRPDRDVWAPGEHASLLQHNHHALVTAGVAIDKFWSDGKWQQGVAQRAALLAAALQGVAALVPGARVLGRGLLQAIDLGEPALADQVVGLAFDRGLILKTSGPDDRLLRLMPALTMPTLLLEQGLATLYRCVAEATGQRAQSAPHRALAAVHAAARCSQQPANASVPEA